ncbi:tripartite tricarboxylate transporter substrate binding protein [Poseidonibacter lekithochrous]|uniref:Bug family tripartite tricarboxylate transporter substrate binding protein n=1 Tax=Poseidonibacter TaxID=2321187 RepID=UPI001C0852A8|nr:MULTISPECIES: tripartite tricarboxylate transporter substrate-binding protein [Poseidonibacter]MBU3014708.1 tripartite tricarboxylate transporter substrate binding protein [Poseidonibacter lekithochrous]MDO6828006.1 tripartite tricarboxylate transporter substrate-binding protein [Poseidonibacter sp. 1_MG-2023]
MYTNIVKSTMKVAATTVLGLGLIGGTSLLADNYPTKKPVNMVVGFGIGGSADRMTRSMTTFLSDELETRVKVVNKKGAGTQIAANYVLKKPADGYTVFASTFAPYLANTILSGNAKYTMTDFDFLNIQWFDFELFALNKNSKYNNMMEVIDAIKNNPKTVKAAVVQGSGGHLLLKLLLEKLEIPQENLNLVTYSSGGKARTAVAGGQVDLIAISAQGSESIREFIKPIAIVKDKRMKQWDAPTLNEAIKASGKELPVFSGSMRGFAVSKDFKAKYPKRYVTLVDGIKRTLANKSVQSFLKKGDIGYTWTGPEESNRLINESFKIFESYSYLLEK